MSKGTKDKKKENVSSASRWYYIATVVIGVLIFYILQYKSSESILIRGYVENTTIKFINHDPNEPIPNTIAMLREPVVLRNTFMEKWPARSRWNIDYLSKQFARFNLNVNTHNQKVFKYFNKDHPMSSLKEVKWKQPSKASTISFSEFIRRAININNDTDYVYYSSKFDTIPPNLIDDIYPIKDFKIQVEESEISPTYSMWMGGGGVTAHTHYDSLHNLFAQLIGRKTFILSPPRELEKMYLYSSLHPSYRQSQVDFEAPNITLFPNFYNVSAIKVTLEPGDMLYLPPFWYHRVIAEDFSASVSVWTDSEETVLYLDKIMVHALPFEEGWSKTDFQVAIKVFIEMLIEKIGEEVVVKQRYLPIFGNLTKDLESKCLHIPEKRRIELEEKFEKAATEISRFFKEMQGYSPNYRDGEAILKLHLANYIENMSNILLGIENVNKFLQFCF